MHSTGCEEVHNGGQDGGLHHGGQAGHHGVHLTFQGASNIVLSEHDYVMADIKKEVVDWEDVGKQEEEGDVTEDEGDEEEDIDGDEEEEEEEEEEDEEH